MRIRIAVAGGLAALALTIPAADAGAVVRAEGNSAFIDAWQSVSFEDEVYRSASESDFLAFGRTLAPPELQGPAGRAKSTAQIVATVVSGDSSFPLSPIAGTAVSGRLTNRARKSQNPDPYAPVAYSDGEYDLDFEVTRRTRFQLAGAMTARNTDPDDCSSVLVLLLGPIERTFRLRAGLDCAPVRARQGGFVETGKLPPGDYGLEVEYDTSISPDPPGDVYEASAAVDMSLEFNPPDTKLTKANVSPGKGKASFGFKAKGKSKGFQCALSRGKRKPKFRKCRSPKEYENLKPGRYLFQVRARGKVAPDATPAKKRFRIG